MRVFIFIIFLIAFISTVFNGVITFADEPASPAVALTYYVDVKSGSDTNDGLSRLQPFKSIQAAADRVNPGDAVIVNPGVYYESVDIRRFGTQDAPITFKADAVEHGRVIITGADREIREKKIKWKLENKELNLYSIPFDSYSASLDRPDYPARVLYSGVDLYPYASLELLNKFSAVIKRAGEQPAPRHGYFWDQATKKLYVRLHASGQYGSTDPSQHLMAVAPAPDGVYYGNFLPTPQSRSNIKIIGDSWPGHIIIDGFTFEAPSLAAVYTSASDVTVRNCWFEGCRLGVSGNNLSDIYHYRGKANRVTVHNCYFTQKAIYQDALELLKDLDVNKRFWHRKHSNDGLPGKRFIYEAGLIGWAGLDWDVHHNHIVDGFEPFSSKGTNASRNLKIHENLIERMLDNVVELERHAQNLSFYRNVVCDVFSPVSWQTVQKPLPGPAYIYQNVFYNTPQHLKAFGFRHTGVFKIMGLMLGEIPPPGLLIFNNTVFWPEGFLMGGAATGNHPDKIAFYNNILAVDFCFTPREWKPEGGFVMARNLTGAIDPRVFAHRIMGGRDGILLDSYNDIGFKDVPKFDFSLKAGSPAIGKAIPVPGTDIRLRDIGAVQQGDTWYPLTVGPKVSKAK